MKPTVLTVAQWQGSASTGARRLSVGADRLSALSPDLPHVVAATTEEQSETRGGVLHFDALLENAQAVRSALDGISGPVLVIGGDCGSDTVPLARARTRHGTDLAVVWFDAHGDLNTPQSSPTGGYHGMVLRTLLGDGPRELTPEQPLTPDQVVFVGTRSLDAPEAAFIDSTGIPVARSSAELLAAVERTGATQVYIHLDLDVLDPAAFAGTTYREPDGLQPAELIEMLTALRTHFPLAGMAITEYAPVQSPEADEEVLRTILAAIT
jgi:arginase